MVNESGVENMRSTTVLFTEQPTAIKAGSATIHSIEYHFQHIRRFRCVEYLNLKSENDLC